MSIHPRIYLDHNSTSPLVAAARQAMAEALDGAGNPSSIHREGRQARHRVETARDRVAALLGARRDDVVFTSGGSEANRLGITGLAAGRPIACAAIEHPSVLGAAGTAVARIAVDGDGRLDLAAAVHAVRDGAAVVAIGAVNHELGVVQDLAVIVAAVRAAGARLHVDAVQAAGKRALAPVLELADTVAISAHKLGGPTGVGALWIRAGTELGMLGGGHQEKGRRPGTESVVGIAGFGAAAGVADAAAWPAVTALGAHLELGLVRLGARVHGGGAPRVGGTINAGFPGALGESIVIALDLAGVAASTGAACTSGTLAPSAVLLGLGMDEPRAQEAVRFSLGRSTTRAEIDHVLAILPVILDRARR